MWSDPFYSPEHFDFLMESVSLESDDPEIHAQGVRELTEKIEAGNTDAMLVLARHYLHGKQEYRDIYAGLCWYLEMAKHGRWEGVDILLRYYKHPEDEEIRAGMQRLHDGGYTAEVIKQEYRKNCESAPQTEHE